MSASHVWELLQELPEDSRYLAAVRGGPEFNGWTFDRYLHTYMANVNRMMLWVLSNQHSEKPSPKPELLPIPGQEQAEKAPPRNELRDMLAQKRAQMERAARNDKILNTTQ